MMNLAGAVGRRFPSGRPQAVTERLLTIRRHLDHARPLPDFLIIGGQRCGTSSLYKYLGRHPLVVPSLRKEIRYLSDRYDMGEAWYRSHFPSRAYRAWLARRNGREPLTFEASPAYLFHPWAAQRAAHLMEVDIVAVLRNPIDRAFSHYQHSVRRGWETLSFEEALAAERNRLAGHAERLASDPNYHSKEYLRFSYASRGFYAEQLERWMVHFPIDRILVLRSEDLFERSLDTYHQLLDFLGLPRWTPAQLANHSYRGSAPPESRPLHPALRRSLHERFAPHNQRLSLLLGRDFGWDQ